MVAGVGCGTLERKCGGLCAFARVNVHAFHLDGIVRPLHVMGWFACLSNLHSSVDRSADFCLVTKDSKLILGTEARLNKSIASDPGNIESR